MLLGLGSAITLASANAFVKASGDVLMSRAVLSLSGAAMVLPAAFFVPLPTAQTWGFLALSLPAHWCYQAALIRAMHRGDTSVVTTLMSQAGVLEPDPEALAGRVDGGEIDFRRDLPQRARHRRHDLLARHGRVRNRSAGQARRLRGAARLERCNRFLVGDLPEIREELADRPEPRR